MAYVQVQQSVVTHRKTLRLARLLGMDRYATLGRLVALWSWCLDNALDGSLGDVEPDILADVMAWEGKPAELVEALLSAGFLDLDPADATLRVHDWYEHMGVLIERREENARRMRESRATARAERQRLAGAITPPPPAALAPTVAAPPVALAPATPPLTAPLTAPRAAPLAAPPAPTSAAASVQRTFASGDEERATHVQRTFAARAGARVEKSREEYHEGEETREREGRAAVVAPVAPAVVALGERGVAADAALSLVPRPSPVKPVKPAATKPIPKPASPPKPRPRDVVWDACIASMGGAPSNDVERGKWARGIKALRQSILGASTVDGSGDGSAADGSAAIITEEQAREIVVRAGRYRQRFGGDVPLNPMALAGNWTELARVASAASEGVAHERHASVGRRAEGRSAGRPAVGSREYYAQALAGQTTSHAGQASQASQASRAGRAAGDGVSGGRSSGSASGSASASAGGGGGVAAAAG